MAKKSKQSINQLDQLVVAVSTFFIAFMKTQFEAKKPTFEKASTAFESEDVKNELTKIIESKMPKPTKVKKVKDPNAPKRPMSSYLFFARDNRQKIADEHKDLDFKQISALLGELWHELDDKAIAEIKETNHKEAKRRSKLKAKYIALAEEAKAEYKLKVKDYVPSEVVEPVKKKSRRKKDKDEPANGKTAYILWSKDTRESIAEEHGVKGRELSKLVATLWKAMSDEDKEPWEAKSKLDKEEAKIKIDMWKKRQGEGGKEEEKPVEEAPKKRGRKKKTSEPVVEDVKEDTKEEGATDGETVEDEPVPSPKKHRKSGKGKREPEPVEETVEEPVVEPESDAEPESDVEPEIVEEPKRRRSRAKVSLG